MDNVAFKAIKTFFNAENICLQLVEPHNHHVNASKHTIQTFKDHVIAGLCAADRQFLLQLWHKLLPQTQHSLNMLWTPYKDPSKSGHEILEGAFNFNQPPWVTPGAKAKIFNSPEVRTSWGPRAVDTWYVGSAPHHYWCDEYFVLETGQFWFSEQAKLYPTLVKTPTKAPLDVAKWIAIKFLNEVWHSRKQKELPTWHVAALKL